MAPLRGEPSGSWSLGRVPLEGMNVVLAGPWVVPMRVICYKHSKPGP
jgi:hypothetical protein